MVNGYQLELSDLLADGPHPRLPHGPDLFGRFSTLDRIIGTGGRRTEQQMPARRRTGGERP